MSEKPPRRRKKEENPEPAPNPELERLIAQAPKGSVSGTKQEIQPEQPEKHIVGGDDASIKESLDKIDTLNFKPGFPPEELFNQTPATKETINDNPVDTVLSKITAEKKLFKADVPGILKAIGGKNASPEAIEKVTKLAAGKFSGTDYNYFLESVDSMFSLQDEKVRESTPNLNFIREKLGKLNGAQIPVAEEEVSVKDNGESQPPESISSEKDLKEAAPENLPGSSPEELKEFEENLQKSVEDWQEKRKTIESNESPEGNIPAVVAEPSFVDAEWKPVSAPRMIESTPETELSRVNKGAFFTRAQKESLARDFGVDASIVSHEEAPEGAFFTPEQKKYLSELDVPMSAGERGGTWKPTTRAEWIEELRSLVLGEKNSEGKREYVESLKEYVAKRSEDLGEKAKEYGPSIAGAISSVVEGYNKLKGWQKLAITAALMTGSALSGGALAIGFSAALCGQRGIAGAGFAMTAGKMFKNPELLTKKLSDLKKNPYAVAMGLLYSAATSYLVYKGVEGLKVAANSEWINHPGEWFGNTREWLGDMLGHDSIQPSGDAVEALVPTPDISSVEVPPDQAHTVQTLDPTLFAEAKGDDQLRILAENSLKHLTPNEQAVLDNHIASLTPRERYFFDQFTTEYSNKINAPEAPLYDPEVDEHIAKAHEAIDRMQKLVDEQAKILNTMPDGSETPSSDLPSPEADTVVPDAMDNKLRTLADSLARSEAGILSRGETDILNDTLNTLTPEQLKIVDTYLQQIPGDAHIDQDEALGRIIEKQQQLGEQSTIEGKIGSDRMFDAQERVEQGLSPGESGKFTGLEHPDGMSDVEKATHNPTGTDAFPKPLEETSGESHFETNAAGLAVDTAHAQAYLDAESTKIIFGGSSEVREAMSRVLVSNDHSAVVFYDSTPPSTGWFSGLFGDRTPQLSRMFWVDNEIVIQNVPNHPLPSIDDLKEVYKPVSK